jgi:RND family efflux transporter MFP subunit
MNADSRGFAQSHPRFIRVHPRRKGFTVFTAMNGIGNRGLPAMWLVLACACAQAWAAPATMTAAYADVERVFVVDGVVEAVKQSTVSAQISGRVIEIRFDAGDSVKQGEVIVRIDEREVSDAHAAAQAHITQAQAVLANARANFERTRQLHAQNFVSKAALDRAQSEFAAAQAQLQAAVAQASQSGTVKGFAVVRAPYSGVVAQRHVELGEAVTPGRPLMTGFDPKELRVAADVPQFRVADIRRHAAATLEFPTLKQSVQAASVTVLPAADAKTHTTRVRLTPPTYVSGSYPGMFARVAFAIGRERMLAVPASAVVRRTEVTAVYVLDAGGAPRLRQVRLGEPTAGGQVEVLAGVQPGDKVVIDAVRALAAAR